MRTGPHNCAPESPFVSLAYLQSIGKPAGLEEIPDGKN